MEDSISRKELEDDKNRGEEEEKVRGWLEGIKRGGEGMKVRGRGRGGGEVRWTIGNRSGRERGMKDIRNE